MQFSADRLQMKQYFPEMWLTQLLLQKTIHKYKHKHLQKLHDAAPIAEISNIYYY